MIKKLLPIVLILVGTGAGVGAGVFLRPAPPPPEEITHDPEAEAEVEKVSVEETTDHEYVKMSNQFVVPLVENGTVNSLIALSLSLEVKSGTKADVATREPKLRDSLLQVLFDHANVGGFRGSFTDVSNLEVLRAALREVAIRDGGDAVTDVLILELARQDY